MIILPVHSVKTIRNLKAWKEIKLNSIHTAKWNITTVQTLIWWAVILLLCDIFVGRNMALQANDFSIESLAGSSPECLAGMLNTSIHDISWEDRNACSVPFYEHGLTFPACINK